MRERRGGPWDWSRDLREQEGFGEHARFMDGLVESGFVMLGGPLEGDREVLLIVDAPDKDKIRERLTQDPWISNGMLMVTTIERWTILLNARPRP
jgi:YCII-related domain